MHIHIHIPYHTIQVPHRTVSYHTYDNPENHCLAVFSSEHGHKLGYVHCVTELLVDRCIHVYS